MVQFNVEHDRIGAEPTVVVSATDGSTRLVIACRGATLLSWRRRLGGHPVELTDGYRSEAELQAQDGVRNGLLAPFPNRIAGGRYRFEGRDHDLQPGQEHPREPVYHGFARTEPFDLDHVEPTAHGARLTFRSTGIRPGRHPGYPFPLDLRVVYLIGADAIGIEIRATNTGEVPAPYAAGWHPYFRLAATIDTLTLQVPAASVVRTDDALIPLHPPNTMAALEHQPAMDFRQPRTLRGAVIDACFSDLRFAPDGRAETVLRDPLTGSELRIWQVSGHLHVFTGDTLARDRRRSIALEPVETLTDAFNRDEYASAIRIEPGEERRFRFGVRHLPPVSG
ncbi:aldose 1-epimerase [Streptacidiphilus carbonis]|uniref:aldose 1-epimerase n=1 Tax=Streptacidiphilus carbonis TaxID=105422 RepID=UPI0005A9CD74|nr:hypothetical protein [Streptacidiphilus carbonis]